jgi:hypothetical protein
MKEEFDKNVHRNANYDALAALFKEVEEKNGSSRPGQHKGLG